LYYLNLFNDFYVPLLLPNAGFDSILKDAAPFLISELSKIDNHSMQYYYPISLSPKEKLFSILLDDEDIKINFTAWMEDIVNYQKETAESMSKSYHKVKERINIKN
jgi:hypothetical protein